MPFPFWFLGVGEEEEEDLTKDLSVVSSAVDEADAVAVSMPGPMKWDRSLPFWERAMRETGLVVVGLLVAVKVEVEAVEDRVMVIVMV